MKEKIPEMECIRVDNFAEQLNSTQKMSEMERTHNTLAKDIKVLINFVVVVPLVQFINFLLSFFVS